MTPVSIFSSNLTGSAIFSQRKPVSLRGWMRVAAPKFAWASDRRRGRGLAAAAAREDAQRRDHAEKSRALKGQCVGAELGAHDACSEGGETCAELVGGEDPAEDKIGARRTEGFRSELHGRGRLAGDRDAKRSNELLAAKRKSVLAG
jgi:hypothetical protein